MNKLGIIFFVSIIAAVIVSAVFFTDISFKNAVGGFGSDEVKLNCNTVDSCKNLVMTSSEIPAKAKEYSDTIKCNEGKCYIYYPKTEPR